MPREAETDSSSANQRQLLSQLRIDPQEREAERRPGGWRWIAAGVAALAILGVGVGLKVRSGSFEVEAVTAVAPSGATGSAAILQATGYVTARRAATVSAQITGTLTQVLIEEGEHVKAGQVLAKLDDTAQQASLDQARAQLAVTQALLGQYAAQLEQARRDLKRNQDLVTAHLVSQQALETAQTQVATLAAQVASQRKSVELARAGVRGAKVQLGYAIVRAPFDGVITAKAAQPGEIISPISAGGGFTRTGVGTIVDMDSLEVEVDVNEAYLNRVEPRQPAEAVLDAYPDWRIPAHVIAIIPTADRSKATVKVRIGIDQKDPRILPDMGVRVSFLEEARSTQSLAPRGVLVPAAAIVDRQGVPVVFVIAADRVHARRVTAGATLADLRLVAGLEPGARVVLAPPAAMTEGARVTVR